MNSEVSIPKPDNSCGHESAADEDSNALIVPPLGGRSAATENGPLTTDCSRDNNPSIHPSINPCASLAPRSVAPKGKVGRLPAAIRNHVCQMMYDGTRYQSIIAWLAENGHPGFRKSNLSRWREAGYQNWLKAQHWSEHRDFMRELAAEQARTDDPTFHDAGVYLAQIQFYEALNRIDGAELVRLVKENRKELLQFLKTFTHFNRYCLQREKFRNDVRQQDKPEHGRTKKVPLRKATMEKICDDMNLK